MLPPEKTGLLMAFLGGLPGHLAARLAKAVEVDRLMEGHVLPHEQILLGLRPVLRRDHFDRTPTPLRIFCRPFQDLLTSAPSNAKQRGSIARASLEPVWSWISRDLLAEEAASYVRECRSFVVAQNTSGALERAKLFWPIVARTITKALSEEKGRKTAQRVLKEARIVEDAHEMALLLSVGSDVEELQALLPRYIPSFHDELIWQVRAIYDRVAQKAPDSAPYIPVVAMNRLAKPWEALRLPLMITRNASETLLSKTDMGLVGEILFDRMESLKTAIKATRHPLFDAEILMKDVKSFAELSSNIVLEIELRRKGDWGKRLLGERTEIGKVMEGFMERAPREFAAALPTLKGRGADFSRFPGTEKHVMALRYARLVAGSRHFAAAASFAAKQSAIYEELCTMLERYNEDLVDALKSTEHQNHDVVLAQFEFCTELTAIMFSEKEAELLRRRAKAARAAA